MYEYLPGRFSQERTSLSPSRSSATIWEFPCRRIRLSSANSGFREKSAPSAKRTYASKKRSVLALSISSCLHPPRFRNRQKSTSSDLSTLPKRCNSYKIRKIEPFGYLKKGPLQSEPFLYTVEFGNSRANVPKLGRSFRNRPFRTFRYAPRSKASSLLQESAF